MVENVVNLYKREVLMKKILPKTVGILTVCIAVFLFSSCIYQKYLAGVDPAVVKELIRLGVVPTDVAKVQQLEIPLEEHGYLAWWGYFGEACEKGGYDLYSYAGKTVTMTSVDIKGTCLDKTIGIEVLSDGDKIVCAYLYSQENDSGSGGMFPVNSELCEY
jgi:hypothetical protein